jgi:hypothetical protein
MAAVKVTGEVKVEHVAAAVLLVGAGVFAFLAVKKSGGTGLPATTEGSTNIPTPMAPVLLEEQHGSPVIWTAHRYPRVCGQEITTMIHNDGHSAAAIPRTPESFWLTRPPSELTL